MYCSKSTSRKGLISSCLLHIFSHTRFRRSSAACCSCASLSASPVLPSTVAYIFAKRQEAEANSNDMHQHVLCDWSTVYLPAVMFHVNDEAVRLITTNQRELQHKAPTNQREVQHKDNDTAGRHRPAYFSLLAPLVDLGTLTDNLRPVNVQQEQKVKCQSNSSKDATCLYRADEHPAQVPETCIGHRRLFAIA